MAIIKCPECGKEISSTCERCVHCGYQLKKSKAQQLSNKASQIIEGEFFLKMVVGLIGGILLLIIGIACIICALVLNVGSYKVALIVLGAASLLCGLVLTIYSGYKIKN